MQDVTIDKMGTYRSYVASQLSLINENMGLYYKATHSRHVITNYVTITTSKLKIKITTKASYCSYGTILAC